MPSDIQELKLELFRDVDAEIYLRTGRALQFLVQELKRAYSEVFIGSRGEAGALGALNYEITLVQKQLEAIVGVGEAGKYLAFLEFGERGTNGGSGLYTRSKAPIIRNIYQWIKRARIATPQMYIDRAKANAARAVSKRKHPKFDANKNKPWYSTDPNMLFAFAIAMKRKKFGKPALRILERTFQAQLARIQQYINE